MELQAAEGGGASYVGSGAADPKAPTPGTRPDGHKLLAHMKELLRGDPSWYSATVLAYAAVFAT